jgi:hypothetical protein
MLILNKYLIIWIKLNKFNIKITKTIFMFLNTPFIKYQMQFMNGLKVGIKLIRLKHYNG